MSAEASATSWVRSAKNLRLKRGHILVATLQKKDKTWNEDEIDLNERLGNLDGQFLLDGKDYVDTASNTTIDDKRPDKIQAWLLSRLQNADGSWPEEENSAELDITDAMTNEDGKLCFAECVIFNLKIEEDSEN
ncbi:hypothetical protein EV426DRAFT_703069 [Tirmania nivea]|nr:hypothetical protein EV426DRAFT_703069 [Tirmania nivea]